MAGGKRAFMKKEEQSLTASDGKKSRSRAIGPSFIQVGADWKGEHEEYF